MHALLIVFRKSYKIFCRFFLPCNSLNLRCTYLGSRKPEVMTLDFPLNMWLSQKQSPGFAPCSWTGLHLYHKKGLHNRCFHANSAKLLATPFCLTPFVHKTSLSDCLMAYNFIKKKTLAQVFSCELCEISKNTFLQNTSWRLLLLFLMF